MQLTKLSPRPVVKRIANWVFAIVKKAQLRFNLGRVLGRRCLWAILAAFASQFLWAYLVRCFWQWGLSPLWIFVYQPVPLMSAVLVAHYAKSRIEYFAGATFLLAFGAFALSDLWINEGLISLRIKISDHFLLKFLTHNGDDTKRLTEFIGLIIGVVSFGIASELYAHLLKMKEQGTYPRAEVLGSPVVITSRHPIYIEQFFDTEEGEEGVIHVRLKGRVRIVRSGQPPDPPVLFRDGALPKNDANVLAKLAPRDPL